MGQLLNKWWVLPLIALIGAILSLLILVGMAYVAFSILGGIALGQSL